MTMSMMLYLASVCGIIYGIFESWCQYTKFHTVVFISYKKGQQYNTCGNGSLIDSEGQDTNHTENLRDLFTTFEGDYKRTLILIACLVLFLFHMVETISNCNGTSANLHSFVSSYNFRDCQNVENDSPNLIPLESLKNEIETKLLQPTFDLGQQSPNPGHNYHEILCMVTKTALSFFGLFFIVALCCIPHFFYLLKNDTVIDGKNFFLFLLVKINETLINFNFQIPGVARQNLG